MKKQFTGAAAFAALALPASAGAHVTVQPNTAQAGGFGVENVRVPNEEESAVTTKVDLRLPDGFAEASYQRVPGWTVKVVKTKLDKPIQTDDGPVTEQISEIVWTADSGSGGIQPGQFQDFPLSVQLPDEPGRKLTFKAVQTYTGGKVVRWIGAPDSDTPAPQVALTKAVAEDRHTIASATAKDDDGDSDALSIIALVVGTLGLGGAGFALATRRK